MPFDWRLAMPLMERRDMYFTRRAEVWAAGEVGGDVEIDNFVPSSSG